MQFRGCFFIMTPLIWINMAPLTELFCNCLLFGNLFVDLVWLTNNYVFGSGNFRDNSGSLSLKILKLSWFYFKNSLRQFIPGRLPKHVITSTNCSEDEVVYLSPIYRGKKCCDTLIKFSTAWKVSKYGVFSGPYFPVFGLNTEICGVNLRI